MVWGTCWRELAVDDPGGYLQASSLKWDLEALKAVISSHVRQQTELLALLKPVLV